MGSHPLRKLQEGGGAVKADKNKPPDSAGGAPPTLIRPAELTGDELQDP